MGKAERLKAARAAERAASHERAPLVMLTRAVKVVGALFGTEPECAHAAALLKMIGDHLGYDLTPRAVSLVATETSTGSKAFLGPRADELIDETDRHKLEVHLPEEGDTGHMVLTSEDPMMLFDPNLPQLIRLGIFAEPLLFPIASTDPPELEWRVSRGSLSLLYLPDGNQALVSTYQEALVDFAARAAQIAGFLRKGALPEDIHFGPKR